MVLQLVLGLGIGAAAGGLLGSTKSCRDGGCPLTANPTRGAFVGGLMGLFVALSFAAPSGGTAENVGASAGVSTARMASITTYEGLQERVNASPGKTLVVFSAAWCSACKRYDPIVKAVAERDDVTASFAYVNVENARELARRLSIEYLPTSLVYENGKEVDRFVGLKSESELVTLLGD